MASNPLKNIPLRDCRKLLLEAGCRCNRTTGGHEHWTRSDLMRPITIQTHIDPVPERIMKQIIKVLDLDKDQLKKYLK